MVSPGDILRVIMSASVAASAFSGAFPRGTTIGADALVDPSFLIPLDFDQRDRYRFVMSANLTPPAALPLPATPALLAGALVLLRACRMAGEWTS